VYANLSRVIFITFTLSGCASVDPWTTRDTALQATVTALLVADAYTTNKIQYRDDVIEGNPVGRFFLGEEPSTSDTLMFFTGYIIASYFISRALAKGWRTAYQGGQVAGSGYIVIKNCQLGLC